MGLVCVKRVIELLELRAQLNVYYSKFILYLPAGAVTHAPHGARSAFHSLVSRQHHTAPSPDLDFVKEAATVRLNVANGSWRVFKAHNQVCSSAVHGAGVIGNTALGGRHFGKSGTPALPNPRPRRWPCARHSETRNVRLRTLARTFQSKGVFVFQHLSIFGPPALAFLSRAIPASVGAHDATVMSTACHTQEEIAEACGCAA
jgi:hypothetical protein